MSRHDHLEPWRQDPDAWKGEDRKARLFDAIPFLGSNFGFNLDGKGRPFWYALDRNHIPYPCPVQEAEKWMGTNPARWVGNTRIWFPWKTHISTVFLALDHNFGFDSTPVLFETMIFGGPLDQYQERYTSWIEAEEGHKRALRRARLAPLVWLLNGGR